MPIYRDPHTGKLKLDKIVAMVYAVVMMVTMAGTSVGAYYSFRSVTSWRLEKCENDNAKCRSEIKDVGDRLTNHAMGESGTQAKIDAVKNDVAEIKASLKEMLPIIYQTRQSQKSRGG